MMFPIPVYPPKRNQINPPSTPKEEKKHSHIKHTAIKVPWYGTSDLLRIWVVLHAFAAAVAAWVVALEEELQVACEGVFKSSDVAKNQSSKK